MTKISLYKTSLNKTFLVSKNNMGLTWDKLSQEEKIFRQNITKIGISVTIP
jgi:hypothetical protein